MRTLFHIGFPTRSTTVVVLETLEDGLLMDPPEGCPTGIYDIMCSCWEMEPNDRPSFPSLQQMLSQSFGELRSSGYIKNIAVLFAPRCLNMLSNIPYIRKISPLKSFCRFATVRRINCTKNKYVYTLHCEIVERPSIFNVKI